MQSLCPKGLSCWNASEALGVRIHPSVTFLRRILCNRLLRTKKKNYFKYTLPHTGSELKVALWASGTPEQFILHVRSVIHICKQMEHDVKFSNAKEAVANATLDLEIRKEEYAQVCMCKFAIWREKRTKATQEKAHLLPPSP